MEKTCNICNETKPLEMFFRSKTNKLGRSTCCKLCFNGKLRKYRKTVAGKIPSRVYEKTKNGFLVRVYRNMLSRVNGIQKNKHHLYNGLELIEKEKFYKWSLENNKFNDLFDSWTNNKHKRTLCPSIDRIDSSKGYMIKNMRWITFSENCSLGGKSKKIHKNKLL